MRDPEKAFVKALSRAIDAAYTARIECRGDFLSLPMQDLYYHLTHREDTNNA